MPKSLHGWLHAAALKWMLPFEAIQEDHGGRWHRLDDEWTGCGRWAVTGANRRNEAGFGPHRFALKSPWAGRGSLTVGALCDECFAVEKPLLAELEAVAVQGQPAVGVKETD